MKFLLFIKKNLKIHFFTPLRTYFSYIFYFLEKYHIYFISIGPIEFIIYDIVYIIFKENIIKGVGRREDITQFSNSDNES